MLPAFLLDSLPLQASTLCVLLAVASGSSMTLAAVVVAFPAQRALKRRVEQSRISKCSSLLANLLFTGTAVGLSILSVGHGPVAVATPVAIGANLLSNMVLQPLLGIAIYSKNTVIGTLVLASAVTMLINIGPSDVPPDESVLKLILHPAAILFSCSMCLIMIGGIRAILQKQVLHNVYLVLLYALVGGSSTVINTGISKAVQMTLPVSVRIVLVTLYVLLSCVGLCVSAQANGALEDPSLFVPIGAGINLVLTCLAGLFIWGDGKRLIYPLCYVMVYVLVVLGSYLVSSIDELGSASVQVAEGHVHMAQHIRPVMSRQESFWDNLDSYGDLNLLVRKDSFSKCVRKLREVWLEGDEADVSQAWRRCLKAGFNRGALNEDDLIELCMMVMQDSGSPGTLPSTAVEGWLENHVSSYDQKGHGLASGDILSWNLHSPHSRLNGRASIAQPFGASATDYHPLQGRLGSISDSCIYPPGGATV